MYALIGAIFDLAISLVSSLNAISQPANVLDQANVSRLADISRASKHDVLIAALKTFKNCYTNMRTDR